MERYETEVCDYTLVMLELKHHDVPPVQSNDF